MKTLSVPTLSNFHKYYEKNLEFQIETKGLNSEQIGLIKYIYSLLSIKEFRHNSRFAIKFLNNLIKDFFNLNYNCFISKEAFEDIEKQNIFRSKNKISKNDIIKKGCEIEYIYLIPIKIISKELYTRKLHMIEMLNILIKSTTKIIIHKSEKNLIKNIDFDKNKFFSKNYQINKSEIEKLFGLEIQNFSFKLINS